MCIRDRVSTYHGTPYDVPPTSVVFCAPSKKRLLSIVAGVGSSAWAANSPIQVVPIMAASGVLPAVMAVANLSWAASQGTAVTSTLTPGLAASKSLVSLGRLSPSAPMAQTEMVPVALPELTVAAVPVAVAPVFADRPQAASPMLVVRASATTAVVRMLRFIFCFLLGRAVARWDGSASTRDPRHVAVVRLGTATRRPQNQLGRQDPWFRSHGGAGNTFVESGRCKAAQFEEGLTNCGQSGADIAGSHDVVPAHDGDVVRDLDAGALQRLHR